MRAREIIFEQKLELPSAKQVDDALALINQDPNAGKIGTTVDYKPVHVALATEKRPGLLGPRYSEKQLVSELSSVS